MLNKSNVFPMHACSGFDPIPDRFSHPRETGSCGGQRTTPAAPRPRRTHIAHTGRREGGVARTQREEVIVKTVWTHYSEEGADRGWMRNI